MQTIVYEGEVVKVDDLPKSVKRLGYNNRMEIMTAANKFGTLEHPMKMLDILEFLKEKENKQ